MEGDVFGVRIIPPVLQFFNTVPHITFKLPITVMNISKTSKNVRYYGPKSELGLAADGFIDSVPNFILKVKNPEEVLAPGLAVTATVEYCPMIDKEEKERIVLTVDGNVIEVPIFAHPCQPLMEITDVVDFGTLVANSKATTREIILTNAGSKKGDFKIKYRGSKHIAIIPKSGTLPPHSEQKIKVEYVACMIEKFQEEAEVHLEGREVRKLKIQGSVIERALELLTTSGDNGRMECIRFGCAYYGTDKTESAILYNNGPEPVSFVAVIDEDAIAQELGVNMTKSTTAALAEEGEDVKRGHINEITSLIAVIPNQGILRPFQKIPVIFRFSPRWYSSTQGWKNQFCPAPRKDFALFVKLQIVGSSNGFIDYQQTAAHADLQRELQDSYAEVALTGTALPVLLNISPAAKLDFGECPVGEHADILCTIKNESNILPTLFEFKRIAHFTTYPSIGKILPGQTQDVIISFVPKQVGTFKPEQLLNVLGTVADSTNTMVLKTQNIYTLPIKLQGSSDPITIVRKPKFNTGITPYITNEVGLFVETTFENLKEDLLRNAVAGSTKTRLHHLKSLKKTADSEKKGSFKVAFPNDRASSIRPVNPKEKYKTLFTHADRYHYIDPEYAYDDIEIEKRLKHQLGYLQQIHEQREKRLTRKQNKEFEKNNNYVDIGIKPAAGIFPKKLMQSEIQTDPVCPLPPNAEWKILSTKDLAGSEKLVISKPVCEGLNAVPTTKAEKKDCSVWLNPQELHQVIIGPPVINFGQICVRSVCQKELKIVNNLAQFIHIEAEIDCIELRQSSPLSQVVPPQSNAVIPIIFESSTKGAFQRSVVYTINGFYKHHVTILAEVVPVAIELSTGRIVLRSVQGIPAEAGFHGIITLYNKLNYPAEFTWSPDLGEKGTAFSIRPASGTVDPMTDLDCEIVWHPSFLAPEEGSFTLFITGGESRKLQCAAEVGNSNVFFMDQRIVFGPTPVNLTTVISDFLHNSGSNHAYFYVHDPNPLPGLTISPISGVVPVGGSTQIQVAFAPTSIIKFDTRVQVAIKGGKTLELRIAGSVESPDVNIDVPSFNFGGVYCGASATIPFYLGNKAKSRCRFEVDLRKYKDFSVAFPGCQSQEDFNFQLLNPGKTSVTLEAEEMIEGELTFTPRQVAAYDFILPITLNHLQASNLVTLKLPDVIPDAPASFNQSTSEHIVKPKPMTPTPTILRKQVIGTAMRQILQLSTCRLEFILPSDFHDAGNNHTKGSMKEISFTNISLQSLTWGFDLSMTMNVLEKGIFKFYKQRNEPHILKDGITYIESELQSGEAQKIYVSFCPSSAGKYQITIPVAISSVWDKPLYFLEICGEMKAPIVWFEPHSIVLTPVPLQTEISAEFSILALHHKKSSKLVVKTPVIELEDESQMNPFFVTFLEGDVIKPCSRDEIQVDPCIIPCKVTFSSPKPLSISQSIDFIDEKGNKFSLQVTATADNCLLTCYPFIAQHRGDHQIICEQGSLPKGCKGTDKNKERDSLKSGEAVFVSCISPRPENSRRSTSATSSTFQMSSSSYESSLLLTDSSSTIVVPRDGAMNKPPSSAEHDRHKAMESVARSAGSIIFPNEDTEEGIFHMEVLMATQRWFSHQGWPGGPYPVLIPETVRVAISKKTTVEPAKSTDEVISKTQFKAKMKSKSVYNRLVKTVYDMFNYLSGKSLPGIPANLALPTNPVERVKQIYWQHCTLLTFLRCQGACVSAILPEYLMPPGDYVLWRQLQQTVKLELLQEGNIKDAEKIKTDEDVGEEVFEAISRRMWTDVLLQILKVFVLAKVTPKTLKSLSIPEKDIVMPSVNPDPLSSNIYSMGERILLAWMNYHYERNRAVIWEDCAKGGVPAARWIVNFDYNLMDGLVLASLLGAHMPFLIKSHLQGMYSNPETAEQCLHNALKVVSAMKYVGMDYDIHAIDITDPNPVSLLLLVIHLYERLPHYLPKTAVEFVGSLHTVVTRQVKVNNTSAKNLVYNVMLAGQDASDFTVPKGNTVTVPAKSTLLLSVDFKSRFLRPAEAVIVLVGKRQGSATGNTLIFNLTAEIDNIKPKAILKVESPCYELTRVKVEIKNPFFESGEFRIVLIESKINTAEVASQSKDKEKRVKKAYSKSTLMKKKPDHLSEVIPMNKILEHQESMTLKNSQIPTLQAFHTLMRTVQLDSTDGTEIAVDFLPFHVGEYQCSVIFLNEHIGEFLYSIEAKALDPLPSYLPYVPSRSSVRISGGATSAGKSDSTIYWMCESGSMLKETLHIPMTNAAKERALIIVAQQQMSNVEMQRRQITGTIMSCSVMAKTLKDLSNNPIAAVSLAKAMGPVADVYRVDVDSEFFQVPDMLVMPNLQDTVSKCIPRETRIPRDVKLHDGVAELTVQFKAKEPGQYPATITLTAIDDVRIYHIECTVTPQGSTLELEFHSHVYQSVTQNIPIKNTTGIDWYLKASIQGNGFHGPTALIAKADMTTYYPLTFTPVKEEEITGQLVLTNTEDETEQVFQLIGKGEKPLALDLIQLTCGAKASIVHTVKVPNVTSKKLTYRVESDLPFITGEQTITVLPHQTGSYNAVITPNKRGKFKGILAFAAGRTPTNHREADNDGDPMNQEDTSHRMWYALEIDVKPPLPEKTVTVVCACHKTTLVEVIVRNPTPKEITLKASIRGFALTGPLSITLNPGMKDVYTLTFAPTQVGETRGSLIFFNEDVGEFWYSLLLIAEPPAPTTLPRLECELGSYIKHMISLNNPTEDIIEVTPTVSNANNFTLEGDHDKQIILKPKSITKVPLKFRPSALGRGDHTAKITFTSEQLGQWVFYASGSGLLPQPHLPLITNAAVGASITFFIVFRNPMDIPVLADIHLSDTLPESSKAHDEIPNKEIPFKLLLKHTSGIHVGPKSSLEIPISFSPTEMVNYQAYCSVIVQREDGQQWQHTLGHKLSVHTTEVKEIRWLYPIQGLTECAAAEDTTNITGSVCGQMEQKLEVTLACERTNTTTKVSKAKFAKTAKLQHSEDSSIKSNASTSEEYSFELSFPNDEVKEIAEKSVDINIVEHFKSPNTGLVTVVFNVRFAPVKCMDYHVDLLVKATAGGVWRFPLRFTATELAVDDTILIEASGLGKPSSVGFRLNSQQKDPAIFKAFFETGSDPEFSVAPEGGELAPIDMPGTLFTVTFLPIVYGKLYSAKLTVQTDDMQWSYGIKGILPEYNPPRGVSAHPIAGPHPPVKLLSTKKNYVRQNLKLLTTAVSSPVKGAHLVPITKAYN